MRPLPPRVRKAGVFTERPEVWISRFVRFSLWLSWGGILLRMLFVRGSLLSSGARFLVDMGGTLLTLTGLFLLLKTAGDSSRSLVRRLTGLMLFTATLLAIYGYLNGNRIVDWALLGCIPFGASAAMLAGSQPRVIQDIVSTLFWQVFLGLFLVAYVFLFEPPGTRGEWYGRGEADGFALYAERSLYGMPFLLAFLAKLPRWKAFVVSTALVSNIALAVAGENRGTFLVNLVVLPSAVVFFSTVRGDKATSRLLTGAVAIVLVTLMALGAMGRLDSMARYAGDRWEGTWSRLTKGAEDRNVAGAGAVVDTIQEEFSGDGGRANELTEFMGQLNLQDWIIGRGFGGTWYSNLFSSTRHMAHFGPAHLVLIGGVSLVLIFAIVIAAALWRGLRHFRRSDHVLGAFYFMLVFLQGFLQHGPLLDNVHTYFMWICVGALASSHLLVQEEAKAPSPVRRRVRPRLVRVAAR